MWRPSRETNRSGGALREGTGLRSVWDEDQSSSLTPSLSDPVVSDTRRAVVPRSVISGR